MDDDMSILEETAAEEWQADASDEVWDALAADPDSGVKWNDDDDIDHEEHAYWDAFLAEERQAAYDEEWGDPLDLPSYGS
jgi:hypothetical protein